jgi:hypothetical protein
MRTQDRVSHHVCAAEPSTENRAGVHGPIDADLVPADGLQRELIVRIRISQFSMVGEESHELVHALHSSSRQILRCGSAPPEPIAIRTQAQSSPAILTHCPRVEQLGANDGDAADDGVIWKSCSMGFFDAKAVLDKDDCCFCGADYGGDGLGVIYEVWEGLRGHDHVVPAAGGCGWRCGCVVDGGVDRVRGEGVGTEVAGFELYAGFEYG